MSEQRCKSCKDTLELLEDIKNLNPIDIQAMKTMIALFQEYENHLPKELIAKLSAIEVSDG